MKNNWKKYKLGDFLERQYDSIILDDTTKYKRLTIRGKGQGVFLRDTVIGFEIGTKNQFLVKENQFLLSKIDAMNGAFGIVPKECNDGIITGNFWTYEIDKEIIKQRFLELLCFNETFTKFSIEASEGTTNRKYLRENQFLNLEILLPPLPEQKRIVAKIESIKEKIEAIQKIRTEQEKEMENLRNSLFIDLSKQYQNVPIGKLLIAKKNQVEIIPSRNYKQVTVRVNHNGVLLRGMKMGSEIGSKQYLANEGDFIISKIDARNGSMGMIPKELDRAIVTGDFPLYNFTKKINPLYFLHFSNTHYFDKACIKASEGTTNRKRLKLNRFNKIEIPLPTIEKQNEIVFLLDKMERIQQVNQQQETELTESLAGLLDKAFKGEL